MSSILYYITGHGLGHAARAQQVVRALTANHPEFAPSIATMTECYSKATDALTLPYHCDTATFPRQQPIPWITRTSALTRNRRAKLLLYRLLSFGGLGIECLPWHQLAQQNNYLYVTTGSARERNGNLLSLPATQTRYEDLLRAVDGIITKPGYGIVADVLAQRIPMLYSDRGDFAEYPRLVAALSDDATAEFIPQDKLLAGDLPLYLRHLLSKPPHWPMVELDGAQVAAETLLAILDASR